MVDLIAGRKQLGRTRRSIDKQTDRLGRNATQLTKRRRDLELLAGQGASKARVDAAKASVTRLSVERADLLTSLAADRASLRAVSEQVVGAARPEELVGALSADHPITLLPVRIETRFLDGELRVRILPDQIHLDSHEPGLTEFEQSNGQDYWSERWRMATGSADAADEVDELWSAIAARFGAPRARWIVDTTTPTNVGQLGNNAGPDFGALQLKASEWSDAVEAMALPDRFVVIGYRGAAEVFRKWGSAVPDRLATSLSPDVLDDDAPDDGPAGLPQDDPMRWVIDYDLAVSVGMAITVTDRDVAGGSVVGRYERVIVLGVDWTLDQAEAANVLDELLSSHRFTDGLEFVAQGTPTNESGEDPRNLGVDRLVSALQPPTIGDAADTSTDGAGAVLAAALGISGSALRTAPGSQLKESATADLVHQVTFASTIGNFLDEMLAPAVSDRIVDAARVHTHRFLRPAGPYSTLRVGRQPYGLIPAMATARYVSDPKQPFEALLWTAVTRLRPLWEFASRGTIHLGANSDIDGDMLKLLQAGPLAMSARFRKVVGLETLTATDSSGLRAEARRQADVRSYLFDYLGLPAGARLAPLTIDPESHPLPLPFVELQISDETSQLQTNYLSTVADLAESAGGRAALNSNTSATSILEAFVIHAALEELDRATSLLVSSRDDGPLRPSFRPDEIIGLIKPETVVQAGRRGRATGVINVTTPEQQANLVIPAITGNTTVVDHIVGRLRTTPRKQRPESADLEDFIQAMRLLSERPAAEIDRSFRGLLDSTSHRLDAWVTSLATRRLDTYRKRKSGRTGTHLGAYGFVLDLAPDTDGDSLGYLHAPSPDHAAAAAILRSGHLSNRDGHETLDINLTSARVRLGLSLIEGVAEGQQLAVLLGYRVERLIHDLGSSFSRFVLPIRQLAPYRSTTVEPGGAGGAAQESIAAHDVVDGLRLLDLWEKEPGTLLDPLGASPQAEAKIGAVLDQVANAYDAVADLMVSESVFQAVRGNWERSGAALAALDRQERPPQPEVVATPRTGLTYTQRLVVVLQDATVAAGWDVLPTDARASAAPRVNAYISHLLPPPATIVLRGEIEDEGVVTLVQTNLVALGLSPISLALSTTAGAQGHPSELEQRIALALAEAAGPQPATATLRLVSAATADEIGVGQLISALRWILELLTESRAGDATDFAEPDIDGDAGTIVTELRQRTIGAKQALRNAVSLLQGAVDSATPSLADLREALQAAGEIGASDALLPVGAEPSDDIDAVAALQASTREQGELVLAELQDRAVRLDGELQALAAAQPVDEQDEIQSLLAQLRVIFGANFPALAPFTLGPPVARANALAASLSEQDQLTDGDPAAPNDWLDDMGLVRAGADRLSRVLLGGSLLGAPDETDNLAVVQLPHVPGQRWSALPNESPIEPTIACTIHAPTGLDPGQRWEALVVDDWTETIPSPTETTAVSFHYDAPGARAPQAILLAVAPDLTQANWTFDALVETVEEVISLTDIRGVQPKNLAWTGLGLPAAYVAHTFSRARPSIDFFGLAEAFAAEFTPIAGKQWESI